MDKENNYTQMEELLVKFITGMADDSEQEMVLNWIKQSDENNRHFNGLKEIYEGAKLTQPETAYNVNTSFEKVKAQHYKNLANKLQGYDRENIRLFRLELMKYAALIAFLITLGVVGYRLTKNNPPGAEVLNTVEAPFGSRAKLTLADGTKVWLNAGSRLSYSSKFGQHNRKVLLTGEAFFDVVENKSQQFVVSTSHLDIKVFGTRFNIKAYNEEDIIQTTLVEGSVMIEEKGLMKAVGKKTLLKPKETATYFIAAENRKKKLPEITESTSGESDKPKLEIDSHVDPIIYTSWKDDKWLIEGESLASLSVKLERRYNVQITISSQTLQHYKFSGTIKEETLEQVLNVIKLSAPISYKIESNHVELFENTSFKHSYDDLLIQK